MSNPKLDAYLTYNGNTAEAFAFYEKVLGAKIVAITPFKDSPMGADVPPEFANRTLHARLLLDDQVLMASDAPPGLPYEGMSGFSLSLNYPTVDHAKRIFAALSEGGKVTMPIDKTFWAEAFGMVVDRFGVPWMVGCEKSA